MPRKPESSWTSSERTKRRIKARPNSLTLHLHDGDLLPPLPQAATVTSTSWSSTGRNSSPRHARTKGSFSMVSRRPTSKPNCSLHVCSPHPQTTSPKFEFLPSSCLLPSAEEEEEEGEEGDDGDQQPAFNKLIMPGKAKRKDYCISPMRTPLNKARFRGHYLFL